jgi:putative oxidoreductase
MWNWLEKGRELVEAIPYAIVALASRFAVATVFWRSGQTKVEEFFHIKKNTFFLFSEEYKVPLHAHSSSVTPSNKVLLFW